MIIPLKKVSVLSFGDAQNTLESLGAMGLMHIDSPLGQIKFPELEKSLEKSARIRASIKGRKIDSLSTPTEIERDIETYYEHLLEEEKLNFRKTFLLEEYRFYEHFGKIELSFIKILEQKGEHLHFYDYDTPSLNHHMLAINEKDNQFFGISSELIPNEKEENLPTLEYSEIQKELLSIDEKLKSIERAFHILGDCTSTLDTYENRIKSLILLKEKTLASKKAIDSMDLYFTFGFIREVHVETFLKIAKENSWAYEISDVQEGEYTPVLLQNNKVVEDIVYPFYDFMSSWPSPHGKDPSIIFAVFTVFFSAILVGDAGYGLALILTAFLLRKKLHFPFMYYLGLGCLVWGSITGTWFGNAWLVTSTPLRYLVIESLSSFNLSTGALNTEIQATMGLMFIFGGIHLSIAKLLSLQKSFTKNLETIGDLSLIWGMVYAVRVLMAGETNSKVIVPLVVTGLLLGVLGVLFSKDTISNKIKNILLKPLNVVNGFSDIMSYIRLFAVGFASLIVGMVASLIANMTGSIIAGGLILILMNTINLSLGMIAILVHAIRLNNLEFANNSGLELGSKKFIPFKI